MDVKTVLGSAVNIWSTKGGERPQLWACQSLGIIFCLYFCIFVCHIFVGSDCLHLQAPSPVSQVICIYLDVFNLYCCCDWFLIISIGQRVAFYLQWRHLFLKSYINCIYMAGVNLYLYFIWIVFIWPGWMASCVGLPVTPVATFQSHYTLDILQYQSLGKILHAFPF